jgi:hypothetical protein
VEAVEALQRTLTTADDLLLLQARGVVDGAEGGC